MSRIIDIIEYQQKGTWDMKEEDELFYGFSRQTGTQIDTLMKNLFNYLFKLLKGYKNTE